jgi:hypothetical protein
MTVVESIFAKETETFTPFSKIGSAAKDPNVAFALTVVGEKIINPAVRRIYSGKRDHFLDALHFLEKNEKIKFRNQSIFWETYGVDKEMYHCRRSRH